MAIITKNNKWLILGVLNLISSLCFVSLALITKYILDFAEANDKENVIVFSLILLGMIILGIVFKVIENILYTKFSISRELELKRILLENRLLADFQINAKHSALLLQNYTVDINNILAGEMETYPSIFYQLGRFIFAIILVAILDWRILLVILGVGVLGAILARIYSLKMKKHHQEVLVKDGNMNSFFQETIDNLLLVKAYKGEDAFLKHYEIKANEAKDARKKKYHLQLSAMNLMVLVSNLVYGACIGYGSYAITIGLITYGSLLALTQLIGHLQAPLLSVSSLINQHSLMKTSYKRLEESLSKNITKSVILKEFDMIKVNDLAFGYNSKLLFSNLSFEIKPKDIIKVAGESGLGKTTLFMLLLGFLKPNSGQVEYKYHDISLINSDISSLFSYVPQDNILFSGTIKENFELLTDASEEKMYEALKFAQLDGEIDSLDIVLNQRGKGLSVGQLQRLMIAIAYAKDRPIFLLDEFSSALDKDNTDKIINNIIKENKTIIYISHKNESIVPTKEIFLN